MSLDIQEVANLWGKDEPEFQKLGLAVKSFIKKKISEIEILPEISHRTKELLSIIKKIKKKQRENPQYDYYCLNDKLGIRIICNFSDDLENIDKFLFANFNIIKVEIKKEELDYDRLDYISNHYDTSIKADNQAFKSILGLKDLVFEIQVRTLNQHAWSNAAHSLSYKQEADLAPHFKRRIYRLLSLYEIADDEFSSVNKALLENPDNKVYTLLRKLEGKIYKFAQVDYDREMALYDLRLLLSFLTDEEQKRVFSEIDEFLNINAVKIENIFLENRSRYFEIPILTQPEIFLIWFALEFFLFSIEDNWDNEFDHFELEQIKALWGKSID